MVDFVLGLIAVIFMTGAAITGVLAIVITAAVIKEWFTYGVRVEELTKPNGNENKSTGEEI